MKNPSNQNPVQDQTEKKAKISGYGGYSTRHEYEKLRDRRAPWKVAVMTAIFLVLTFLAVIGISAIIQGDFLQKENSEPNSAGSIKVPTQSELGEIEKTAEEMIDTIQLSLITVEVMFANGSSRFGSGFVISETGHAVCSSHLFEEGAKTDQILAHTGDGFTSSATLQGNEKNLGIALLKLEGQFLYTPITVENSSFVERGENLFAVGSTKPKVFYGTVKNGIVASVGPAISFGNEEDRMSVNMLYVDFVPNDTLYGAPVVDAKGGTVGFCTKTLASPYPATASVVPINIVYAVVNELQGKS